MHNLEHYFLSGAPFMDLVFFPEDQQVSKEIVGIFRDNYFNVIVVY